MIQMSDVNREYKDRLFKFVFGHEEHKDWTLSLYNAINGTDYTNYDDIEFTTVADAVYMKMKNDVSFLISNTMNFYEHQSTINPNMPMRFLIYSGMVYSKYIETTPGYHRFSKTQQKAPTPKCICFYNGKEDQEDKVILSLRDTFNGKVEPDIEVKVTMLNINYGHNKAIMEACKPLREYSLFNDNVRTNMDTMQDLEKAIDKAIDDMPDDSVIKPFLIENKAEVKIMCITEYDEARMLAEAREEGKAEGIAEGENLLSALISKLLASGRIDDISKVTSDVEYRHSLYTEFGII